MGGFCRSHSHHPHAHHPHAHQPGPGTTCTWPVFASRDALQANPWGAYYAAVYGALPTNDAYPLDVSANWLLHDGALIKARVQTCKASECPLKEKDRYSTNDMYQPPLVSWIWHAYPYSALASHAWVEVLHEADPFGDEHHGMWLVYAPGSGIYFNTGAQTALQPRAALGSRPVCCLILTATTHDAELCPRRCDHLVCRAPRRVHPLQRAA